MQRMLHHVLYQNDNGTSISHTRSAVDRNRVNRGSPEGGETNWRLHVAEQGKIRQKETDVTPTGTTHQADKGQQGSTGITCINSDNRKTTRVYSINGRGKTGVLSTSQLPTESPVGSNLHYQSHGYRLSVFARFCIW